MEDMPVRLTILGMNGPFPAAQGATSGYLLTTETACLCFDLGTGTLARLTALCPPETLDALVLSHWHYDHCADLLPLIYRLEACSDHPLHVWAPVDEASPVRQAALGCSRIVLHDVQPGDVLSVGDAQLRVYPARHPVPAVMYRVEADGRTFCYTGDTNTTEGLSAFAKGADLLLADGLFPAAAWAENKPHLSAEKAAQLAAQAGAARLIITHLNPMHDPATLLREARVHRLDALLARAGDAYEV